MRYLTAANVLQIHFEIIEETGGSHGIRDVSLLESAVERPKASFGGRDLYPNLVLKAASLIHSLLLNHPFLDGNKRTVTLAMIAFLKLNGTKIKVSQKELVDFALWVENEKPDIKRIADWIKKHSITKSQ